MMQRRRNKCQTTRLRTQKTLRHRLRIFQTLLQTWGITHTYDAPHPLKVYLFPSNHRLQLSDITRDKEQKITYDLILNLMLILTSDDLTLSLRLCKKKRNHLESRPNRSDNFNYRHTTAFNFFFSYSSFLYDYILQTFLFSHQEITNIKSTASSSRHQTEKYINYKHQPNKVQHNKKSSASF